MRLKLEEYNYEIEYVPGTQNTVADCLSRIHLINTWVQMDEISLKDCETIAIFSSPDIVAHNSLITPTMLKSLTDQQQIKVLEDSKNRFLVLCFVRETEHELFDIVKYKSVLIRLCELRGQVKK